MPDRVYLDSRPPSHDYSHAFCQVLHGDGFGSGVGPPQPLRGCFRSCFVEDMASTWLPWHVLDAHICTYGPFRPSAPNADVSWLSTCTAWPAATPQAAAPGGSVFPDWLCGQAP